MKLLREKKWANGFLAAWVSFLFASTAWAGPPLADLEVEAALSIPNSGYVGTPFYWTFEVRPADGSAGSILFPTDSTVLIVDLPEGLSLQTVYPGSGAYYSGDVSCSEAAGRIECVSLNNFTMSNPNSLRSVTAVVTADVPGEFSIPAAGGICRVDPDNVVDEGGGDGATSNDCFGELGPVVINALPDIHTDWLLLSENDNVARDYDHEAGEIVNAVPVNSTAGADPHSFSDVVRNPLTGDWYVLYHAYETTTHHLGVLDPATASLTDVGDTGQAFHDAAFAPDGSLYAIGRDQVLYGIDPATGAATGLCTPLSPIPTAPAGLAWHPDHGLLEVVNNLLIEIDTAGLPLSSPAEPCAVTTTGLGAGNAGIQSAAVVDGRIYLASFNELFLLGLDGAKADLGRMAGPGEGLAADPGTLPVREAGCPAPFYTTLNQGFNLPDLLFALDPADGSVAFVPALVSFQADTLEWDTHAGLLYATGTKPGNFGNSILLSLDPCSGSGSELALSNSYQGFDISPDGVARLFDGEELYELDLDTGAATPVAGPLLPYYSALAIRGDQVFLDSDEWPETTQLHIRSLSGWGDSGMPDSLLLSYAVDMGESRIIYDLDVDPNPGGLLYGLVLRDQDSDGTLSEAIRPNVLARISDGGTVVGLMDLPNYTENLTGTWNSVFSDGYENEVSVNGCYDLFDSGTFSLWTFGPNAVSTSGISPVNDRPLFNYSDPDCVTQVGPASPIAHADSPEEADALCQSIGSPFGQLIAAPVPAPPFGAFYACDD